jgi:mRNA-degrading endonuclease YafQ of YafQ-DinJ toxin-antitoxin module
VNIRPWLRSCAKSGVHEARLRDVAISEAPCTFLSRHADLSAAVHEAMVLIEQNPAAPSLRTHGLKGAFAGCSASRLSREYRIIFVLETDRVIFIDIGTHDDVYR